MPRQWEFGGRQPESIIDWIAGTQISKLQERSTLKAKPKTKPEAEPAPKPKPKTQSNIRTTGDQNRNSRHIRRKTWTFELSDSEYGSSDSWTSSSSDSPLPLHRKDAKASKKVSPTPPPVTRSQSPGKKVRFSDEEVILKSCLKKSPNTKSQLKEGSTVQGTPPAYKCSCRRSSGDNTNKGDYTDRRHGDCTNSNYSNCTNSNHGDGTRKHNRPDNLNCQGVNSPSQDDSRQRPHSCPGHNNCGRSYNTSPQHQSRSQAQESCHHHQNPDNCHRNQDLHQAQSKSQHQAQSQGRTPNQTQRQTQGCSARTSTSQKHRQKQHSKDRGDISDTSSDASNGTQDTMNYPFHTATPPQAQVIHTLRAEVIMREDVIETPSDPRPNAFFCPKTGVLRVYHGNAYGNPYATLLPHQQMPVGTYPTQFAGSQTHLPGGPPPIPTPGSQCGGSCGSTTRNNVQFTRPVPNNSRQSLAADECGCSDSGRLPGSWPNDNNTSGSGCGDNNNNNWNNSNNPQMSGGNGNGNGGNGQANNNQNSNNMPGGFNDTGSNHGNCGDGWNNDSSDNNGNSGDGFNNDSSNNNGDSGDSWNNNSGNTNGNSGDGWNNNSSNNDGWGSNPNNNNSGDTWTAPEQPAAWGDMSAAQSSQDNNANNTSGYFQNGRRHRQSNFEDSAPNPNLASSTGGPSGWW